MIFKSARELLAESDMKDKDQKMEILWMLLPKMFHNVNKKY